MDKNTFLTNTPELRRRAREHIASGAVTDGYRADRRAVLELLDGALATEIVCMLRYKRHAFMARGPTSKGIVEEFRDHANEELVHADLLAERMVQLGGAPNFSPEGMLARSHSEYIAGATLVEMVEENLVAERIAVESYGEFIRYLGDRDPTTKRLIEGILAVEEEHAEELATLMGELKG